jgi:16S rRNA G966 N2-methylase RsmD
MDWEQYIKAAGSRNAFDIIFLDPPYDSGILPKVLCALFDANMVKESSIIICESGAKLDVDDVMISERYNVKKEARYGRVFVTYFTPKKEDENE